MPFLVGTYCCDSFFALCLRPSRFIRGQLERRQNAAAAANQRRRIRIITAAFALVAPPLPPNILPQNVRLRHCTVRRRWQATAPLPYG